MKSQIILSTLAMTLLLSLGGVATSQAAMHDASADAAADHDSRDSSQPVTDTWITTKVKAELASTDAVKSTDISVTTVDGKVTLTGVLDNDLAVKKAIAAAKSVKGVKSVDASGLKARD